MHDLRALVVDDSKVGRLTMMKKLEPMGIRVDLAESGQEALDLLAQSRPDLIFMDHMMPDMDGLEVTRRLKASPLTRDIPVIIISGNDEADFVRQARDAGAVAAIAKPPAAGILETLLASLPAPAAPVAAPPGPAAPAAPLPAPAAPAVTAPALSLEQAQSLLADLRAELRAELRADFETRLGARDASLEALRRQGMESETRSRQLEDLAQQVQAMEAALARPLPDVDALRRELERRIESELARQAGQAEAWAPALESLRRDLQARLEEHAALWQSEAGALRQRLDGLAVELVRLEGEQPAAGGEIAARMAALQAAVDGLSQAAPPAQREEETPAFGALRSELAALNERLGEPRLRQLVANALAELAPAPRAPSDEASLRAELARLQGGLRRLGSLSLVGGALLLAGIGLALFLR